MKILGFAHATFANVLVPLEIENELEHSFLHIPDSPAKSDWLKENLGSHSIKIYSSPFPIEVTTYSNSTPANVKFETVLKGYFSHEGVIQSSTFNLEFFHFILHFSSNAFLNDLGELVISQVSLGKSIKLRIDKLADPMGGFLDEPSLCCLAFFVDQISVQSLLEYPGLQFLEKISDEFEINLKANRYVIRLLRIKGVNIELIKRH